jgi:hypothetical protein
VTEAADSPDIWVPPELRAGVYADYVGELVARVALSRWSILKLQQEFARRME